MDRRTFLGTVGAGLIAAPRIAIAQPGARIPRIGFLGNASPSSAADPVDAFREGLKELGWAEGQTVQIEYRWAGGESQRISELATDLVRVGSDIIVVSGSVAVVAAQRATNRIPITIPAGAAVTALNPNDSGLRLFTVGAGTGAMKVCAVVGTPTAATTTCTTY
jgi:putative tryptophan/tyrosine transport system substrate-binding protein